MPPPSDVPSPRGYFARSWGCCRMLGLARENPGLGLARLLVIGDRRPMFGDQRPGRWHLAKIAHRCELLARPDTLSDAIISVLSR